MCDSSSDESSLMDYLAPKKTTTKSTISAGAAEKKKTGPSISYTGSCQQPMSLDDDNSDASSTLEILPPSSHKILPRKITKANAKPTAAAKSAKIASSYSLLDCSDSDSDDSFLNGIQNDTSSNRTVSKKPTAATADKQRAKKLEQKRKRAEQERKKQEKLAAKQAEQARKKAEREAKREQKAAEREAAKADRKRQRLEQQQARGNFATQEIVLLVDPPLFRRPKEHDCFDWREHEEMTTHNCSVQEYPSALGGPKCHALQWIRRDHLKGGAEEAWEQLRKNNPQGYTHLDRLVIVMDDPKVFMDLLHRTPQDDSDDDYPKLREWLLRLEHGWKAAWPQATAKRPNILLLLLQAETELDRQWNQYRKRHKNSQRSEATPAPPSTEEFYDAKTWMLIQFQVECMCLASYEEIWTQVLKMTRAMATAPYQHPMTELECIKRLKPMYDDHDPPLTKAKDTWLRQLQQIPGISENKARQLVLHYPTIQSLWQAYQDPETNNPQELVAGCLSNRYEQKMGENIYNLLTSTNPEQILN